MYCSLLNDFLFTCNAVLPILILIVLGYFLKKIKLLPDTFWKQANRLCFRVCLPVLLFYNIYNVENIGAIADHWNVILFVVIAILSVFFIGLFIVLKFVDNEKQKGVLLQCIFRSNYAFIGIPLAELLSGNNDTVKGVAAIISAVSIPLFNILATIALSIFIHEDGQKISAKVILKRICKNPLIIGVFTGLIFLAFRELIPTHDVYTYSIDSVDGIRIVIEQVAKEKVFSIKDNIPFAYTSISNIAKVASPLALISIGGDFNFQGVKALKKQIIFGVLARLVIVPATLLLIAYFLGFREVEFPALIALFATPVAVSSVPMSVEMKNDGELAGQLVVWATLFSAITLFIFILICASIGIFAA